MNARLPFKVAPNLVDRVISYFDPTRGRARLQARAQMAITTSYIGADRSRRSMRNWWTTSRSADDDLLPDLPLLRERSRDLLRNTPIAVGAVNSTVTNVVGTGLMMQPAIDAEFLGLSEEEANEWQKRTAREFRLWAENPLECDATGGQNFYGIQDLGFRTALATGDAVATLPSIKRRDGVYGTKVQMIDSDRLSAPWGRMADPTVYGGIEVDIAGMPVAYHIANHFPGAAFVKSPLDWDRIPARGAKTGRINVVHAFRRTRPDQRRGEPFLASVIEPLKQLDRYTEAEIMAAVISGMFTVFIQHTDPADATGAPTMAQTAPGVAPDMTLGSGAIVDLAPGETINAANPGRPNSAFDPFVQAVLRQIGAALELPFEILIKHFASSYSASRAAILEAWRFYKVRRSWLADNFCQPIYQTWLAEAIAMGRIHAPGFFSDPLRRQAWSRAVWLGDGASSLDPLKEILATEKRLELGITTQAEETAAYDGGDWEAKTAQRSKERKAFQAAGLWPPASSASGTSTPPAPDDAAPPDDVTERINE